ncbi:hypothetical protein Ancab_027392 [Ancistrocladus abbreviatus]
MEFRFSVLFLLPLFPPTIASSFTSSDSGNDDLLIRQVVDGGDHDDPSLTAHHHFTLFRRRFRKSYASQEEHDFRFKVFKANLRRAKHHQQLDPSATHGITQFSDLTP